MEAELARWVTENNSRLPIVAFMAGRFMDEMPGMSFGHAGTIVEGRRTRRPRRSPASPRRGSWWPRRSPQIPDLVRERWGSPSDARPLHRRRRRRRRRGRPGAGGQARGGLPGGHLRPRRAGRCASWRTTSTSACSASCASTRRLPAPCGSSSSTTTARSSRADARRLSCAIVSRWRAAAQVRNSRSNARQRDARVGKNQAARMTPSRAAAGSARSATAPRRPRSGSRSAPRRRRPARRRRGAGARDGGPRGSGGPRGTRRSPARRQRRPSCPFSPIAPSPVHPRFEGFLGPEGTDFAMPELPEAERARALIEPARWAGDRRRRGLRHLRVAPPRPRRDRRGARPATPSPPPTGAASRSGWRPTTGRSCSCTWAWRGASRSTRSPPRATGTASRCASRTAAAWRCATSDAWAGRCWSPTSRALGPDAAEVSRAEFRARIGRSGAPVKARIMDQSAIAGVGNLLADEILWRARHPPRPAREELSEAELDELRRAHAGGHPQLAAPRRRPHGRPESPPGPGRALPPLRGAAVARPIGGRTTFWCPVEQV